MQKDRSHVPIINLNLNKEFTKNSNKLLRELLQIFIEETPRLKEEINEAFDTQQKQKLNDLLHKLYGSCVYCGLTRLTESLIDLKKSINNNKYPKNLLNALNKEIKNGLKEARKI